MAMKTSFAVPYIVLPSPQAHKVAAGSIAICISAVVFKPPASGALYRRERTLMIIHAVGDPIVVAELELSNVAVQVPVGAVLIDAPHAALEDGEEAFKRVRVGLAARPFILAVVDRL